MHRCCIPRRWNRLEQQEYWKVLTPIVKIGVKIGVMKRLLWLLKITRHYYRLFGMAETLHKIVTFLTDNEKKKALNSDAFVNQLIHEKFQKKHVICPETDYFILDSHVNNKSRKLPFIPDERHKCNEKCKKFI